MMCLPTIISLSFHDQVTAHPMHWAKGILKPALSPEQCCPTAIDKDTGSRCHAPQPCPGGIAGATLSPKAAVARPAAARRCPGLHIRAAGWQAGLSSRVAMALLWLLSCLALAGFARAALPESVWGRGARRGGLGARAGGNGGEGTRGQDGRSRRPTAACAPQTAACPPSHPSSAATTASSTGRRRCQGPGHGRCPSR